jgi:hypothetical protein
MSESKDIISFKSAGPSGDLISSLAGVKQICNDRNAKADIFMHMDVKGYYYQGAVHPYGNSMFSQYALDMMKPLVEIQNYVNSFQIWKGQQIMIDLDKHRERMVGMPYGSMARWIGYVYHELQTDLSRPWIGVDEDLIMAEVHEKILINRTSRYQNGWISYFFLEKYKDRLMFTGLPEEHKQFQIDWNLEIPLLEVRNFFSLAQAIKSCKFFIGNQSMCYALAEAMKVPRLLEVCDFAPNVIPIGENAYDFRFQESLMFFVEKMDKAL